METAAGSHRHASAQLRELKRSLAVAEAIRFDAHLIEHPQVQIAKWRIFRESPMGRFLDPATRFARHDDR